MKRDTAAVEQKLYEQFNELTDDGRLVVPENEVEVSYFSTEGGKDIFKVKGLCYRDFVYSDGTPCPTEDLPEGIAECGKERNDDISVADVLGTKTN